MGGVVVVGAGQAGFQAAISLRQCGFPGRVLLVDDESVPPYQRPPLSKAYLGGKVDGDAVQQRPAHFYERQGIELSVGDPVVELDRASQRVTLASGRSERYDDLVLATGARPRVLAVPGAQLDGVVVLRTIADAADLRHRLATARSIVVVGGGFVGLEVAAVASAHRAQVTVLEALDRTMARVVSPEISAHFAGMHTARGVDVRHGAVVRAVVGDGSRGVAGVELASGERVAADLVVVGVGVDPCVRLAEQAGLPVSSGIVVDPRLRTEDPAIWAIGDCASHPSRHCGGRLIRIESVQNATDQGRAVAAAITGKGADYTAVPWFWTDQYESRLQIAGIVRDRETTVVRGEPRDGSFSVFCFAGDRLEGVESVNRSADHMAARRLLARQATVAPADAADEAFDLRAAASG